MVTMEHQSQQLTPTPDMSRQDTPIMTGGQPPAFTYGRTIDLVAGRERVEFTVHVEQICHYSAFFTNKDGLTPMTRIEMPEIAPETLETAINWIYTGRLVLPLGEVDQFIAQKPAKSIPALEVATSKSSMPETTKPTALADATKTDEVSASETKDVSSSGSDSDSAEKVSEYWAMLLDLFIFASNYEFRLLRIETMKMWQALDLQDVQLCNAKQVHKAYASLPADSLLLTFIAESYASHWKYITDPTHPFNMRKNLLRFPDTFKADVLHYTGVIAKSTKRKQYQKTPCKYHDHIDATEKRACLIKLRDEREAPKRKRESEEELPELKRRLSEHHEWFGQWFSQLKPVEKSSVKNKKVVWDKDSLIVSLNG